ncbi:sulfite exporter TauE/SafE family protein [Novosphingobium umbonatum]|uniref:Probable membrane transporter protein n=1 Tax=Novosphingobium umbonatum TaxID=1908524 RepID=A0A3S2V4K0_9SPHN|nr:sulfite exporter TauE/SafE family protein [Novosphingobium umbonatum]RVU03245.1 sulfite exporter TauE/SafE family protein [Novosphingobium umbonatum]
MLDTPAAIACALVAVIVSGLAKGGFAGLGGLAMPIMVLANAPVESAAVMLPILIVQDAVSVWSFRRSWDGGVLKVMVPGMTLGVVLGYFFSRLVSEGSVLLAVGVVSMLFGLQRLWQERGGAVALPSTSPRWVGLIFGAASGFTSHVAHAGAPPFQMWVLPRKLPRDSLVGTTAIAFAYMNWIKVPAYAALGQFTPANLWHSALLGPVALASTFAGVHIVRRVDAAKFYRLIYCLMILVGVKLVWDGVMFAG